MNIRQHKLPFKDKLTEFILDLNTLLNDTILYPEQKLGRFELKINDEVVFDNGHKGCVIDLWFREDGITHVIYHTVISGEKIDINSAFQRAYWEILRNAFLSIDCVGKLSDQYYNKINVLSFKTLMSTGLEKLKNDKI